MEISVFLSLIILWIVAITMPAIIPGMNQMTMNNKTIHIFGSLGEKVFGIIVKYLKGCNINDLTPLDDSLIQLEQAQTSALLQAQNPSTLTNYKGFILEVVTEVYSPTVNRVKAVAKNQQGIILLQTPLSFTTIPQILIEEIKLIIDSNNLKAY